MNNPKETNQTNNVSDFLSGDLTETYLSDTELDSMVGGISLKAGGRVVARSATTLGCWEDCTVSISGCKKLSS